MAAARVADGRPGFGMLLDETYGREALFDAAQGRKAPSLIALRIDDKPAVGQTERDPNRIRDQFMRGLGVRK